MKPAITRLDGSFGAVVDRIDLGQLADDALRDMLYALYEHRFLVLRGGALERRELIDFARRIGRPIVFDKTAEYPEIISITNVGIDTISDGTGAAHWHTDQSFRRTLSSATMLYSRQAPRRGGETRFCDMAGAYAALPAATRRSIETLVVAHRHGVSVAAQPDEHKPIAPQGWDPAYTVFHPLVRRHPVSGQRTLYAVTGTSQGIVGMDEAAATALLRRLCAHAFQPEFTTSYAHRVHDLVIWDNPTTMHSATPVGAATGPDDTRRIDRISLRGWPPILRASG